MSWDPEVCNEFGGESVFFEFIQFHFDMLGEVIISLFGERCFLSVYGSWKINKKETKLNMIMKFPVLSCHCWRLKFKLLTWKDLLKWHLKTPTQARHSCQNKSLKPRDKSKVDGQIGGNKTQEEGVSWRQRQQEHAKEARSCSSLCSHATFRKRPLQWCRMFPANSTEEMRKEVGEVEELFEILEGPQSSLSLVHPSLETKSIMHEAQKVREAAPCCRPPPVYKVASMQFLQEVTVQSYTIKKVQVTRGVRSDNLCIFQPWPPPHYSYWSVTNSKSPFRYDTSFPLDRVWIKMACREL